MTGIPRSNLFRIRPKRAARSARVARAMRVESLEDRRLLAVRPTFMNDDWHFLTDSDDSGSLTAGDIVRNDNDPLAGGLITAVYGISGFGEVTTGDCPGSLAEFVEIQEAIGGTTSGGTLNILPGVYRPASTLLIDRPITLQGPQAGVECRGSRGSGRTAGSAMEAVIDGSDVVRLMRILANEVRIDGLDLTNTTGAMIDAGSINDPGDSNSNPTGRATGSDVDGSSRGLSVLTGYRDASGRYAIENLNRKAEGDPDVKAENNLFGTVNLTRIASVVYDEEDDATRTRIDFAPPAPSFANTTPITIPNSGEAIPYPSTINVSGLFGTIIDVNVKLNGLSHTFPDDLDILLVGPEGHTLLLMSDCGGGDDVASIDLTLDDEAASPLPDSTVLSTGTYRPADFESGNLFPSPAPASPYRATLAAFDGSDPNGAWSLYVLDDASGDQGSISGGWSLDIAVMQVNVAPVLAAIGNQTVTEQATLTFQVSATDQDNPAETLTYSLDQAAMNLGMRISPSTGQFRWTPTESQGGIDLPGHDHGHRSRHQPGCLVGFRDDHDYGGGGKRCSGPGSDR